LAVGSPHDRQNERQLKQQHGGKVVVEASHGVYIGSNWWVGFGA
jgi:hypothetical protein